MTGKRERADGRETREALLSAAAAEFAAKGYALASVREICRRAGANAALANRYFGSKAGLYRTVARRLFGDLGEPLARLAGGVRDAAGWRAAIRAWVDDFLYMTLPTEKAQRACAGLFRQEVTCPTRFHAEFRRDFGKPVYGSLRALLAMALDNAAEIDLWTASVWAQVSVYALADRKWHASFRPEGVAAAEWREKIRDHVCAAVFRSLAFKKGGR